MRIQLQNILLPCEDICNVPELYYHEYENRVDFDGYFNLFYLEKRKAYTNFAGLYLIFQSVGYSRLLLMHDRQVVKEIELEDTEKEYIVSFPYEEYSDGVFWFSLIKACEEVDKSGEEAETKICKIKGYFSGEISEEHIWPVNIGIDICTYRREEYVLRNLRQLMEKLLDNSMLDAASHVRN